MRNEFCNVLIAVFSVHALAIVSSPSASLAQSAHLISKNQAQRKIVVWSIDNLPKNALLHDNNFQESAVFCQGAPSDSITSRDKAVGRRTRIRLERGQIIMNSDLVGNAAAIRKYKSKGALCGRATFVRARRAIAMHSVITGDDVRTDSMSAFEAEQGWTPRADLVIKHRARKKITADHIFQSDDLEPSDEAGRIGNIRSHRTVRKTLKRI
jgi:hypothetical protein